MALFDNICRFCAKSGRFLFSLFKTNRKIVEIIVRITEIQIQENDGLPQQVCCNCLNDLNVVEKLFKNCRKSEESFRKQLTRSDKRTSIADSTLCMDSTQKISVSSEQANVSIIGQYSTTRKVLESNEIIEVCKLDSLTESNDVYQNKEKNPSTYIDDLIIVDPMAQVAESQEANYTQCCGCVENFSSHEELQRHSQLLHKSHRGICGPAPENLIECCICYKMFSGIVYLDSMHRLNAFKNRLKSIGFPKIMQCCSCEVVCSTKEELLEHSAAHNENKNKKDTEKPYECEFCFKRYSKKHILNFHQKFGFSFKKQLTTKTRGCRAIKKRAEIECSEGSRKCCGCPQEFASADSLKQHSQMHHELYRRHKSFDTPFECEICFKQFPTQIRLEQHKLVPYTHIYKCLSCEKSFRSLSLLTKHMDQHKPINSISYPQMTCSSTMAKSVQCEKCGLMLGNEYKLRLHVKTNHSKEKPFHCSLCSRQFKWKHLLQNHLRVHTKEQPFACSYCYKHFTQLIDKNRHELTHTKAHPLRCSICNKGFPAGRKKLLENHEKIHKSGEEYPFTCQYCDRTFTRKPQRNRHQARHVAERNQILIKNSQDLELVAN